MNILEHYLVETIKVEEYPKEDWMKEDWVEVEAVFDCYGNKRMYKRPYPKSEWEEIVKKGYFMG